MHNRRTQWTFRLSQEAKHSYTTYFITLTYNEDNLHTQDIEFDFGNGTQISTINRLDKPDVQRFLKRIRYYQEQVTKRKIRFYCVGEYGRKSFRPHYHIIIFNLDHNLVSIIARIWKLGMVKVDQLTPARIHYITKYHVNPRKQEFKDMGIYPEFTLMSKGNRKEGKVGIGYQYISEAMIKHHREHGKPIVKHDGYDLPMPRYYKNRIWNEAELEAMTEESRSRADDLYWKEIERLKKLGYNDADAELFNRYVWQAEKVQQKAEDGGML
jgi:hypothetical protein